MIWKRFWHFVVVGALGGIFSLTAAEQPNLIFIMADDLGYGDLGCYGQKLIRTPNIDRLAAEGIRFTQAYAGGPVCTSSRSVLMTGFHNGHTSARDNVPHFPTYLEDNDLTVAEVLKEAGYRTGGVGKWSLGDPGTAGRATRQGFDSWFGYLNQDHAHFYYTEYLDDDDGRLELAGNVDSREHYSHDLLTERALRFIRESKDEPFFLYAAYTVPHFAAKEEDPDGFTVPSTEPYSDRDWDERSKKYASMVHRLDRDVGRIADLIDELGFGENTLIVFTSDNGGHQVNGERFRSSGPLRGFKRDLSEGGIRVPFIARWPGSIPANHISEEVIAFQDMLPTFAELAGVEVPENLDGISVVGALKGEALTDPHDWLYWDYGHNRARYDQAVRLGNWKGIRLGQEKPIQLYDLSEDIGEANDLAKSNPDIVAKIEAIMGGAATPSDRYEIGKRYRGKPIWNARTHHISVSSDFVTLFDGETFEGWEHGGNWAIENGAFYRKEKGGSLTYTAATVPDDFELHFEWKVSKGCNSGVYYRPGQVEYQVLDNVHSPYGENARQAAASLFFCMAPKKDATRPHGEWNSGRVICKGPIIEHWLNGERVISFDYTDPKWAEYVKLLGIRGGDLTGRGGRLWLQDHGQDVWFRKLRWREIPKEEKLVPDPGFEPMPVTGEALEKEQARVKKMLERK